MKILVCSESKLKETANANAFREQGIIKEGGWSIKTRKTRSFVNEQPEGIEEIMRGAENRIYDGKKSEYADVYSATESGIVKNGTLWSDVAYTIVEASSSLGGRRAVGWSTPLPIYDERDGLKNGEKPFGNQHCKNFIQIARDRGFETTTVGQVLYEYINEITDGRYANEAWFNAQNPHGIIGHFSDKHVHKTRAQSIVASLLEILPRVLPAQSTFYPVKIGLRDLKLPLTTIGDVRLCLFNIRGDWETAEEAAKALLPRVPNGIEVLLMPQGKAENLLASLGRLMGVPTVVAIKMTDAKSWMRIAAKKTYTSITTGKPQTIALTEEDVAKIRGKVVAGLDDVVSTGESMNALLDLADECGAVSGDKDGDKKFKKICVFTEGDPKHDVISLGHLPITLL